MVALIDFLLLTTVRRDQFGRLAEGDTYTCLQEIPVYEMFLSFEETM
jgi:hypothetical protein